MILSMNKKKLKMIYNTIRNGNLMYQTLNEFFFISKRTSQHFSGSL